MIPRSEYAAPSTCPVVVPRAGEPFGARCVLVRPYPELRGVDKARRAEHKPNERAEKLDRLVGRRPRIGIAAGDVAVAILEEAREDEDTP